MEILVEALKLDEELESFNHKLYPKEVVVKAVEDFNARLNAHEGVIGECQPVPDDLIFYINPASASHVVKGCWIEGNTVVAKLKLVGKYREMADTGIQFKGALRTFDVGEKGEGADGKHSFSGPGIVAKTTIVTVDLIYREEFE